MKKIKIKLTLVSLLIIIFLFIISGCTNYWNSDTITITDLEYKIENIDSSYWVNDTVTETCFINFWIHYKGDPIIWDFIEYARVYLTDNDYWNIKPTFLNSDNQTIGGWNHLFLDTTDHTLPLGEVTVKVKLKNGHYSDLVKTIGSPNSLSTNGYSYVYTPGEVTTPPATYVANLEKAILSATNNSWTATNIEINFTITDPGIKNGFLEFYNADGDYLGSSKTFKTSASGTVNSWVNGGVALDVTGGNNQLILTPLPVASYYNYSSDATYDSIYKVSVILTDGSQFTDNDYNYLSRSAKTSLSR